MKTRVLLDWAGSTYVAEIDGNATVKAMKRGTILRALNQIEKDVLTILENGMDAMALSKSHYDRYAAATRFIQNEEVMGS